MIEYGSILQSVSQLALPPSENGIGAEAAHSCTKQELQIVCRTLQVTCTRISSQMRAAANEV